MGIRDNLLQIRAALEKYPAARLVAVSKGHPSSTIQDAYAAGQRIFGESRPQELVTKARELPSDADWHFIGHLQRNKVREVISSTRLIHSVDSMRLFEEIRKQSAALAVDTDVLLQIRIAREETKFGLTDSELDQILESARAASSDGLIPPPRGAVRICGLMGMATHTDDRDEVRKEFRHLRRLFERLRATELPLGVEMRELSMGMSGDYLLALDEGSTLVRVGTMIFGDRTQHAGDGMQRH